MSLEEKTNPNPPVLWSRRVGPVVFLAGEFIPACRSHDVDPGPVQRITAAQAIRAAAQLEDPLLMGAALGYLSDLLEDTPLDRY